MRRPIAIAIVLLLASVATFAQSTQKLQSGLVMSLETNKERYEVGEPADLALRLLNSSDKPLNYGFSNMPASEFWVTTAAGKEVWRSSPGKTNTGHRSLRLEPGNMETYRTVWNQTDSQGKQVGPGWYEVYAKFAVAGQKTAPLRTRIKVDDQPTSQQIIILVPVMGGIDPLADIGRQVSMEGILRRGPQGIYLELKSLKVKR